MGLPKRRGTIASEERTPSSRLRAERQPVGVPGQVRVLAVGELLEAGPRDRRAGPVAGWGWPACAARCSGGRDDAPGAAVPSPPQPPRGADHPHPTPPARDAADHGSERAASAELAHVPEQLRSVEAQCPVRAAAAQEASASSVPPATPAAPLPLQGARAKPETSESGDPCMTKPPDQGVLPHRSRKGSRASLPGHSSAAKPCVRGGTPDSLYPAAVRNSSMSLS